MDETELTEVPLSNHEVLLVLETRLKDDKIENSKTSEMLKYLQSIKEEHYEYPLEILRNLKINKNLEADLDLLTIASNLSDLSILSSSDSKKILTYFNSKK